MAGDAGWSTTTMLGSMAAFLANFPGRYFALALGTNDVPAHDSRQKSRSFASADWQVVHERQDRVLRQHDSARRHGPRGGKGPHRADDSLYGRSGARRGAYNAEIQSLCTTYGAKLVHGPDLYTVIYDARATVFDNPTDLHPNAVGDAAIRHAWADAMVANVYGQ